MSRTVCGAAVLGGVLALMIAPDASANPNASLQAQWWQWAFSLPRNHSPLYDNNGSYCMYGQRGDVWFLAGNAGGKTVRSCTVPAGVSVFIPVINVACTYEPVAPFDDLSDCIADTRDFMMGTGAYAGFGFSGLSVTVNGTPQALPPEPTVGDAFAASVPVNAIFGYRRGTYPAVDLGWYYKSEPLEAGSNPTIRVTGQGYGFSLDVTYKLRVVDATYPD